MDLLNKIIEDSSIIVEGKEYKVLGKGYYVTQKEPNVLYAKILLPNHYVLVISPSDSIAYFGQNRGLIEEFNSFDDKVYYNNKCFEQVNHDYQILIHLLFGSPLEVEGEVEFWDYECDNEIISIAEVSRNKLRADVIAQYIDYANIDVV